MHIKSILQKSSAFDHGHRWPLAKIMRNMTRSKTSLSPFSWDGNKCDKGSFVNVMEYNNLYSWLCTSRYLLE